MTCGSVPVNHAIRYGPVIDCYLKERRCIMSRLVSFLTVGAVLLLGSSAVPTGNQYLEARDGVAAAADSTVTSLAEIRPTATPTTIPG